ncbi:MAG: asparagine--tRNA ligase [Oligoflexia bacterium]|nr:asparagine--tRNA ligase [Oligoflexia bacterium]
MSERVLVKTLISKSREELKNSTPQMIDSSILVKGWVRSLRKSKKLSFIMLNDGSTQQSIQVVVEDSIHQYDQISSMITGFCISVRGLLKESQGQGQSVEILAKEITILGGVTAEYPLQKKSTSLEFLREIAHLRPRTNTFGAVFRVRHAICFATHKFFNDHGFFYIHPPITTGSDCEGAGQMFRVTTLNVADPTTLPMINTDTDKNKVDFSKDFYGKETHLTVSGQLEAECMCLGLGSVYSFGPTFRAENSNTPRHLSEFWMIEPEMAFYDLDDTATLAANYIKYLIGYVLDNCDNELKFLEEREDGDKELRERLKSLRYADFKRITYTDAMKILEDAQKNSGADFEFKPFWGCDLQTEHERYLTEKHFAGPVIVTDYPKDIKAFYMKQNDDGKTVRAMDVLVPGVGEIIGGSQREDDYNKLLARIHDMKLEEKDYWWYLDLRKFGSAPHSGFGLGLERAVMYITGISNIRDVIPFPRYSKNAEF